MALQDKSNPERIHTVLQQFRVLLRSIKRHYQTVERQAGLGGAQVWALSEVAADGGLSLGELSRRLAIHLSTASNLVRRLESLGLVTRKRAGSDQRVVRLRITAKGRAALRRAPGPPMGLLQRALLDLPLPRLSALNRELKVLLDHVRRRDARAGAQPLSDLWDAPAPRRPKRPAARPGASR